MLGSTWNRGKPSAQAEAERLNRMRTDGKGVTIAKSMGVEKNRGREKSEKPREGWWFKSKKMTLVSDRPHLNDCGHEIYNQMKEKYLSW